MVEVITLKPTDSELTPALWRELQEIGVRACEGTFAEGFSPETYMDWDDPKRFAESHRHPQSEVGRRVNANQDYYAPLIAIGSIAGRRVAWAYVNRHNVSGGGSPDGPHNTSAKAQATRGLKLVTMRHDYIHVREAYVLPEFQGQDIGTAAIRSLLKRTNPIRPVATYMYPGIYRSEVPPLQPKLEHVGFHVTGDTIKEVPGLGEVRRLRLQANSGYEVLKQSRK
jgi:GNAT superfamily N-acetyltransferase